MSQIGTSKALKEEYSSMISWAAFRYLWHGKVIPAVLVLKFMVAKNISKKDELVGYMEKNEDYIIDYDRRKTTGKIIGSG
jgi:hypothetical protein